MFKFMLIIPRIIVCLVSRQIFLIQVSSMVLLSHVFTNHLHLFQKNEFSILLDTILWCVLINNNRNAQKISSHFQRWWPTNHLVLSNLTEFPYTVVGNLVWSNRDALTIFSDLFVRETSCFLSNVVADTTLFKLCWWSAKVVSCWQLSEIQFLVPPGFFFFICNFVFIDYFAISREHIHFFF